MFIWSFEEVDRSTSGYHLGLLHRRRGLPFDPPPQDEPVTRENMSVDFLSYCHAYFNGGSTAQKASKK